MSISSWNPMTPGVLAQLMKRVAARQTRYVNRMEGRTGTLWDSRDKSSPVEMDWYVRACARSIALHPVRAKMVHARKSIRGRVSAGKLARALSPGSISILALKGSDTVRKSEPGVIKPLSWTPSQQMHGPSCERACNEASSQAPVAFLRLLQPRLAHGSPAEAREDRRKTGRVKNKSVPFFQSAICAIASNILIFALAAV